MRLLRFALILSLIPAISLARGGGGGGGSRGGGGGGARMSGGGGARFSGGGGSFRGGSVGGGSSFRGGSVGGGVVRSGVGGGFRGGVGGFRGFNGGRYYGGRFYGGGYFGLGYGYGWPYYGYYGYGYPYYDPYYSDPYYSSPYYYGDGSYYGSAYDPGYSGYAAPAQPSRPVVVQQNIGPQRAADSPGSFYQAADFYLIAFNDHTIRAALSYNVEGDQIHWTSREHEEKSAPLSSVDRRFSEQINRDRHVEFRLP
jgi:hypothetical protein